jgi:hypothetical protein
MYRDYLKTSLTTDKLKEINRNSAENTKYCNGLCQDLRNIDEFSGKHVLCNKCRNYFNLADKQILENKITKEQFIENPEIVYGIDIVYDTLKECITCKQNKSINQFDDKRNECKACRSIKSTVRNNDGIDTLISDINKIKNNLIELEKFIVKIPKDKLIKIISHFSIGRKSTDAKNDMIYNVIQHFRKLLNPKLCSGGCGYTLQEEFSYCKPCLEKKNKPRAVEVMFNFDDNIDDIVANLQQITHDKFNQYNREQYYKIAAKLGIKVNQKTKKDAVVNIINEILKKREEERQKQQKELIDNSILEKKYTLTFNGMTIQYRKEDGFVNATAMCKAGKKKFNDWNRLDSTKELIKTLESEVGIPTSQITGNPVIKNRSVGITTDLVDPLIGSTGIPVDLKDNIELKETLEAERRSIITETGFPVSVIDVKKGGNDKLGQGSWIHPDLAVQLAQWISPTFALQVSRWIRELAVTGSVQIGMEKNDKQILELQNALSEQKLENKQLEKKHNKLLYKRQYHKFHKGSAFYIISTSENEHKLGFEGIDIDQRFRTYRTLVPNIKIHYIVYSEKAHLIEQNMLTRFNCKKLENNHEVIVDIKLQQLINDVETLMSFLNIEKTIVRQEELEKYNE